MCHGTALVTPFRRRQGNPLPSQPRPMHEAFDSNGCAHSVFNLGLREQYPWASTATPRRTCPTAGNGLFNRAWDLMYVDPSDRSAL
jgi:hypothetical protein